MLTRCKNWCRYRLASARDYQLIDKPLYSLRGHTVIHKNIVPGHAIRRAWLV